ncbi:tax1-binding protein 1 homolog B-like [Acropora millepora]|uniref:tax1-binding protein 1 homolog B-like n=1 Tax=Acropora millepora TaxID=45264 RepID=UPI001CF4225D|nr:tax1-binding protein 1 homolog B-like [Acropora millepora]
MHKNNLSPRSSLSGEEEVLDFPGVEDDSSGSNPVSREAHQVLKEAFHSLKKYYEDAKVKNVELREKLKQRERDSSHTEEELKNLLEKSYDAFKGKCEENEELTKKITELEKELKQNNKETHSCSPSEDEVKSEQRKYKAVIEEFSKMGLDVVEGKDKHSVILIERDNLKNWIEGISDGNLTVVALNKDIDEEKQRLRAQVIFLRRQIHDEADKYSGLHRLYRITMEKNFQFRKHIQRVHDGNSQKGMSPVAQQTRTVSCKSVQTKVESMLTFVKDRVSQMKQVGEILNNHNKSLRVLISLSERNTSQFLKVVSERKRGEVPLNTQGSDLPDQAEGGTNQIYQMERKSQRQFEDVGSENERLSMPVQESKMLRLTRTEDNTEFSNEATNDRRTISEDRGMNSPSRQTDVSMATVRSDTSRTGESDVEVIEEEDEPYGAASAATEKWCPICEDFFPASCEQSEFERHVQQHFEADS